MRDTVVIVAGGAGTRMRQHLGDLPKALAPVGSRPLLALTLDLCRRHGFTRVILLLGVGAEQIARFVEAYNAPVSMDIVLVAEDRPRGTAGALVAARRLVDERALIIYGDTLLNVDLRRFVRWHARAGGALTLLVHPSSHPFDSDIVTVDEDDRIRGVRRGLGSPVEGCRNLASAALWAVERSVLERYADVVGDGVFDLGRDFLPHLLEQDEAVFAYRSIEFIKDVGTPERLAEAEAALSAGRVSLVESGRARSAVFLDRDGTMNEERGGVLHPDALHLFAGAAEAVRAFNEALIPVVVVTNQPYVARGELAFEELGRIHARLDFALARESAFVDAIYACPHHPDRGFAGEVRELKGRCACRKPGTGMLLRASRELGIELDTSWMIGDATIDVATARAAGTRSILVRTGFAGRDGKYDADPDYVFADLWSAAEFVTVKYPRLLDIARRSIEGFREARILLLGGQARAGKSTWARILADAYREIGRKTVVLQLDRWIASESERSEGVLGRYDTERIATTLRSLKRAHAPLELRLPRYDRLSRKSSADQEPLCVYPDDVVIVEGVPALHFVSEAVHDGAFEVRVREALRRRRFFEEYRWRCWPETEIEAAYRRRQVDEVQVVDRISAKVRPVELSSDYQ